jgi:hypothetical protein
MIHIGGTLTLAFGVAQRQIPARMESANLEGVFHPSFEWTMIVVVGPPACKAMRTYASEESPSCKNLSLRAADRAPTITKKPLGGQEPSTWLFGTSCRIPG